MQAEQKPTANGQLRHARELRGWSQRRVADIVGTSKFMVSRWERGVMRPSPHFREQLCVLFESTAEELGFLSPAIGSGANAEVPPYQPFWYVPLPRNPFFTGRAGILEKVNALLQTSSTDALTRSYALHGLGGIGKTQLAVEYAYQHALEYTALFWIGAESVETITASFLAIADILQVSPYESADQQQIVAAVQHWLATHTGWLLIWDNLEDLIQLTRFLPSVRQGAILITARSQALGTLAQGIEVQTMEKEEGILLLLRRAKVLAHRGTREQISQFARRLPADYAAAQTLVTIMGGLPLALDQAGAYIEETGCSVSDYLQRYTNQRAQLLDRRGMPAENHPESITATFRLAKHRLEQDHPIAANLLYLCALLHAEAIPEEFFTIGALHLGPVLSPLASDPSQLDLAIAALRTLSLIQRYPETHTLSIHRLVQAILQEEMSEPERRQWQQRAIHMLNALFPEAVPEAWQQCERYLSHVLTCAASMPDQAEEQDLAQVLYKAADYLRERAQYALAEPLYQRARRIGEKVLGPEHPEVATTLNGLARLFYEQGKYEHAEALHQRAWRIREQALGSEHPQVAISLNNLAVLYEIQGKYEQAEALFQRALHIREQLLGPEHPDIASSFNNLAIFYNIQGKYEQAEAFYQQALRIWEQALGTDHPYVAMSLNNLGILYKTQGKYRQAEKLFQQALSIWEQAMGSEHPYVASSLNGLADLSTQYARYEQAEALYRRALALSEQALGPEHPQVASLLNGLGDLSTKQGKYEQAERSFQRALHISEQAFGLEHPETAHPLNGLADLFTEQGKYEQAEELYQQVLHIREQTLGSEHLDMTYPLGGLAGLYRQQAKYEQAETLYQRSLMLQQRHLEPDHPELARTLAGLALLFQDQGKHEQAEPLLRRACAIFEQHYGPAHPETVKARNAYQILSWITPT